MTKEKKQFTELSDEDLKQVTGGAGIDCSLPENKDKFQCRVKLMGQDATWDLSMSLNPVDFQVIPASFGRVDVIE